MRRPKPAAGSRPVPRAGRADAAAARIPPPAGLFVPAPPGRGTWFLKVNFCAKPRRYLIRNPLIHPPAERASTDPEGWKRVQSGVLPVLCQKVRHPRLLLT
jgi:hypothetical protein